jgi:hypothetical protein
MNRRVGQAIRWAAVASLALLSSATAAEKPIHITGIYSDLRYNKQAGDLMGTEIFILPGPNGHQAFFQTAFGEQYTAVIVPVDAYKDRITFTISEPLFGAGVYEGRISATGFVGTITTTYNGKSDFRPLRLRRKNSYWQ